MNAECSSHKRHREAVAAAPSALFEFCGAPASGARKHQSVPDGPPAADADDRFRAMTVCTWAAPQSRGVPPIRFTSHGWGVFFAL